MRFADLLFRFQHTLNLICEKKVKSLHRIQSEIMIVIIIDTMKAHYNHYYRNRNRNRHRHRNRNWNPPLPRALIKNLARFADVFLRASPRLMSLCWAKLLDLQTVQQQMSIMSSHSNCERVHSIMQMTYSYHTVVGKGEEGLPSIRAFYVVSGILANESLVLQSHQIPPT